MLCMASANCHHYEKFFEIEGGPEYMYYFAKFKVGSPEMEQSAILDTGSDTLAFPCDYCETSDCGTHQDPRFSSQKSDSFQLEVRCPIKISFHEQKVCQFVKSYAEGSSLLGFLASDYLRFKNAKKVNDPRLKMFNSFLQKDLKLKAEFGCTTKETGLFKTQYADGIIGLDNASGFIESVEQSWSSKKAKLFSFGLCFHSSGGLMSIDMRNKNKPDEKIVMLNKKISDYKTPPLIIDYTSYNSYYDIRLTNFGIGDKVIEIESINVMIDSGTTFTHFPNYYIKKILSVLNGFCSENPDKCGKIPGSVFNEDSCLQFKKPDENYANEKELLDSFPEIKLYFQGAKAPYVLYPWNYFYKEFDEDKESVRLCMALKGEEEGRIILGAFSMIDHYFYFDRKAKKILIFEENCFVRSAQILKKDRILEELGVPADKKEVDERLVYASLALIPSIVLIAFFLKRFRNKKQRVFESK